MIAVALVALALGGWNMIILGNKASFCRWRAEVHAALARQCREGAARPGLSPGEAASIRRAGRMQEIIARKYAAVADNPLLPYPRVPLITPEEEAEIDGR